MTEKESQKESQSQLLRPCWIESLEEHASGIGIPPVYVRWSGIFAIAAAAGRHVWLTNTRGAVYPNLYILMVGPPGTGKSEAESLITPLLRKAGVHLGPQHVSKAALMDVLAESYKEYKSGATTRLKTHELTMVSSELVETFPDYSAHFLGTLARWWDCPDVVSESKRTTLPEDNKIENVCYNMMMGVQPGLLLRSFPIEAWTGGFLARTIYVNQSRRVNVRLRGDGPQSKLKKKLPGKVFDAMAARLKQIGSMVGAMEETEGLVEEYTRWIEADEEPKPKHPRLKYYCDRREHQLEKLGMISALSRGSMAVEGSDYLRARTWLEEAEQPLEEVFLEMAAGDDVPLMLDMWNFIHNVTGGVTQKHAIPQTKVVGFLLGTIASYRIPQFLEAATNASIIGRVEIKGRPGHFMVWAKPKPDFAKFK